MFRTYKHAEVPLKALLGEDMQLWRSVEQGISLPWFYMTIHEPNVRSMWMLSGPADLEQWVNIESPDLKIGMVQLVSPAYLNGSDRWLMEPLHELVEVELKGSAGAFHLYRTESNHVYCDGSNCTFSDADVKSWRVVYSRSAEGTGLPPLR
ncbi:hypothetical protein ACF8C6_15490 [Pseudomonas sp. zbq_18]|uniref:hypothetical protein n=1 Tax=Pseudomonas sp. zbq_18 TaxID=3367251 RepID=UPI00370BB0BF